MLDKKGEPLISLGDIIEIYCRVEKEIRDYYLGDQGVIYPRGATILAKHLGDYLGHKIDKVEADFFDSEGLDEEIANVARSNDLLSFCEIWEKQGPLHRDTLIRVWLNNHKNADGEALLNRCWARFCIVKEVCQGVIYDDFGKRKKTYPRANTYEKVVDLLHHINSEPFSFWDFDNEAYDMQVKLENAAEVLAFLLLVDLGGLYEERKQIIKDGNGSSSVVLQAHDYMELADKYKVPERYLEIFMSGRVVEDIYGMVKNGGFFCNELNKS